MTETDAPRQANIFASMQRGARIAFMGAALFLASPLASYVTGHTLVVDGGLFQAEVEARDIMAVPSVYLNGEHFVSGRISLEELIAKLDRLDRKEMPMRVDVEGDHVTVGSGHKQGQHLRMAGEDLKTGQVALKRGLQVRPAEVGLIASLGINEVSVYRRLRVAFFSTGDELVSIGSTLGEGQIYDSNRYTINGMLQRLGCGVIDMGVVRDDPQLIEQAFQSAAQTADVVITSGGVSVGEADFVKAMLDRLGEVVFWKIAMKPGRPLAYGHIGGAHFFGLPGNPVSVMVTFYQFVRDALLTLSGRDPLPSVPSFRVPCTTPLKKAPGRTEFQRGVLTQDAAGNWSVAVTGEQGSGILRSMCEANCFIILPTDQGNVGAGTLVEVQVMEGVI